MDPKKQQAARLLRMARQLIAEGDDLRGLGVSLYKGILGKAGHEVSRAIMDALKKAYELGQQGKTASLLTADDNLPNWQGASSVYSYLYRVLEKLNAAAWQQAKVDAKKKGVKPKPASVTEEMKTIIDALNKGDEEVLKGIQLKYKSAASKIATDDPAYDDRPRTWKSGPMKKLQVQILKTPEKGSYKVNFKVPQENGGSTKTVKSLTMKGTYDKENPTHSAYSQVKKKATEMAEGMLAEYGCTEVDVY